MARLTLSKASSMPQAAPELASPVPDAEQKPKPDHTMSYAQLTREQEAVHGSIEAYRPAAGASDASLQHTSAQTALARLSGETENFLPSRCTSAPPTQHLYSFGKPGEPRFGRFLHSCHAEPKMAQGTSTSMPLPAASVLVQPQGLCSSASPVAAGEALGGAAPSVDALLSTLPSAELLTCTTSCPQLDTDTLSKVGSTLPDETMFEGSANALAGRLRTAATIMRKLEGQNASLRKQLAASQQSAAPYTRQVQPPSRSSSLPVARAGTPAHGRGRCASSSEQQDARAGRCSGVRSPQAADEQAAGMAVLRCHLQQLQADYQLLLDKCMCASVGRVYDVLPIFSASHLDAMLAHDLPLLKWHNSCIGRSAPAVGLVSRVHHFHSAVQKA